MNSGSRQFCAGSLSVVYRAIDTQTLRYAIKRVEKHGLDYYQTRERELHEPVSSHPHVLTFHCENKAGCYAFFDYDLIRRRPPFGH